jgi:TPR repeat protein
LKSGDIAAARLLLRRAAEAADMRAAMALAATYDPGVLTQLRAMGANADVGTARQWYQKAADWGSPDAKRRLQELAQQ